MATIILLNKPFQVLTQFTDDQGRSTLADYISDKGFYAAGRLDYDSEGLLLLTDNGQLQHQLAHPSHKEEKTYWAQVEGEVTEDALIALRKGVELKDGLTRPAKAKCIPQPEALWERTPPIRERQNIPTSWIELTITEGKNRQVRRMTAAVGFPTLRLIRYRIGKWTLDDLKSGECRREQVDAPAARPKPKHRFAKPAAGKRSESRNKKLARGKSATVKKRSK